MATVSDDFIKHSGFELMTSQSTEPNYHCNGDVHSFARLHIITSKKAKRLNLMYHVATWLRKDFPPSQTSIQQLKLTLVTALMWMFSNITNCIMVLNIR